LLFTFANTVEVAIETPAMPSQPIKKRASYPR
jgi:hypothetical protein